MADNLRIIKMPLQLTKNWIRINIESIVAYEALWSGDKVVGSLVVLPHGHTREVDLTPEEIDVRLADHGALFIPGAR